MKEYCPQGHERTAENTYVTPKTGMRRCLVCKRKNHRERMAKVRREQIESPHTLGEMLAMFMDKTEFTDEVPDVPDPPGGRCLLWTGAKFATGYGAFGAGKLPGPRTLLAHRWLYQVIYGELDDETQLDHLCDNKLCVNLRHVEPVDRWEHAERTVERRHWRKQRALN